MSEIHNKNNVDNYLLDIDKRIVKQPIDERIIVIKRDTFFEDYDPDRRIGSFRSKSLLSFSERMSLVNECNKKEKSDVIVKDDEGNIYLVNGKLQPNTTYKLNGNIYRTDEKGRIIECAAKPKSSPENPRDNDAQAQSGGDDRKKGDQGGHIIGRDLNGDGGAGNLVAMDSRINQSDYKRMENDIKTALSEGKAVTTKTEIEYHGDSERPDVIIVKVQIDGEETVYKFDNNLDGALNKEVPENGRDLVKAILDDTNGQVSSIKEKYDENGELVQTTVWITYTDGEKNYRTKVIIENN